MYTCSIQRLCILKRNKELKKLYFYKKKGYAYLVKINPIAQFWLNGEKIA